MPAPSKAVLISAAQILLDSKDDEDFPIAEIMLRNILMERATASRIDKLDALKPAQPT